MPLFGWIGGRGTNDSQRAGAAEVFGRPDRIVLIPTVATRRGKFRDPGAAVVLDGDESDVDTGRGLLEVLAHRPDPSTFRPPRASRGDVIDPVTHDLVGVRSAASFFAHVSYCQVLEADGCLEVYPSRKGALQADLPVFRAPMGDAAAIGRALKDGLDACVRR